MDRSRYYQSALSAETSRKRGTKATRWWRRRRSSSSGDAGGDGCLAHVDVGIVHEHGRGPKELRSNAADLDERRIVLRREAETSTGRCGFVVCLIRDGAKPSQQLGTHRPGEAVRVLLKGPEGARLAEDPRHVQGSRGRGGVESVLVVHHVMQAAQCPGPHALIRVEKPSQHLRDIVRRSVGMIQGTPTRPGQ